MKIKLQSVGLAMDVGQVTEWLVEVGEAVQKGQPIAVIEGDKVAAELYSPAAGIVSKFLVEIGEDVEVGAALAELDEKDSSMVSDATFGSINNIDRVLSGSKDETEPLETLTTVSNEAIDTRSAKTKRVELQKSLKIAPRIRKLAETLNVDLSDVNPSGHGGLILESDVRAAIREVGGQVESEKDALSSSQIIAMTPVRRAIALRLKESIREAPQFTVYKRINVSNILKIKEKIKEKVMEKTGVRSTLTDYLIYAASATLYSYPFLNATCRGRDIELWHDVMVGLVVDTPDGVFSPVISCKSGVQFSDLVKERDAAVASIRSAGRNVEKSKRATFTISNIGSTGVDFFNAILYPGQVAALSIGSLIRADEESIEKDFNGAITFGLTVDHRVVDGIYAGRYLNSLNTIIEKMSVNELQI